MKINHFLSTALLATFSLTVPSVLMAQSNLPNTNDRPVNVNPSDIIKQPTDVNPADVIEQPDTNNPATNNPPASTYQPGPWQPVARVDVNRPVEIQIINQTQIPLEYDLTANITPSAQQIMVGETTTLNNVSMPIYLLIYRSSKASPAVPGSLNLKYDVSVNDNNTVTITVTQVDENTPGYSTFNLNKQGAIYIY